MKRKTARIISAQKKATLLFEIRHRPVELVRQSSAGTCAL